MNILITAGGTQEKIDDVRYIANHSTGKLGVAIAEEFLKQNDISITYIHGVNALTPQNEKINLIPIFSASDLEHAMKNQLTHSHFDAVIHSMAVSDYTVKNTLSEDELINGLVSALSEPSNQTLTTSSLTNLIKGQLGKEISRDEKKISSSHEHLYVRLSKNPKIISQIKRWQPETLLFGFKLLVDVSDEQLLAVAAKLAEHNHCDFVLANDLTKISEDHHRGLLLNKNGQVDVANTKVEIATLIVEKVTSHLNQKG